MIKYAYTYDLRTETPQVKTRGISPLQATLALCFTQRKLLTQNIRSAAFTKQAMRFYALYNYR